MSAEAFAADATLASGPELAAAAVAAGSAACAAFDASGALVWTNPAGRRLCDASGLKAFGPLASRRAVLSNGRPTRSRLEIGEGEARRWLNVRLSRLEIAGRAPLAFASVSDVSTEMRALASLRAVRERANDFVALVSDVIWETDADWRLTYFVWRGESREATATFVGRTLFEIGDFERVEGQRAPTPRLRALFRDRPFDLLVGDKRRMLELSGAPVFDADGVFRGHRGSGRDVTESRRAARSEAEAREALERTLLELEERNRMLAEALSAAKAADVAKSNFLARMSHELRTPLNAILGLSSVLKHAMGDEADETRTRFLDEIHSSGRHLVGLVDDVLAFTRNELSPTVLDIEPTPLLALVREAAGFVRHAAEGRNIAVEVDGSPRAVAALDARRIRQVLINLLGNAVKFSRPGGAVRIMTSIEEGGARFLVEDEGVGVPAAQIERVFEPFHQADGGISRAHGGVGLGLALCKQIVEAHEGRITLRSVEGKGTSVEVTLPPSEEADR